MSLTTIPLSEAKTNLSRYGRMAEQGHSVVVRKHARPAFMITPIPAVAAPKPKRPGIARGRIHVARDFDSTPESIIRAFEGRD
jgi:prevent-host-death family protein